MWVKHESGLDNTNVSYKNGPVELLHNRSFNAFEVCINGARISPTFRSFDKCHDWATDLIRRIKEECK